MEFEKDAAVIVLEDCGSYHWMWNQVVQREWQKSRGMAFFARKFQFSLVFLSLLGLCYSHDDPEVCISNGCIRGSTFETYFGKRTVCSFRGIFYAEKPERFKASKFIAQFGFGRIYSKNLSELNTIMVSMCRNFEKIYENFMRLETIYYDIFSKCDVPKEQGT